jgi:16S rRNA processing protein RimM
MAVDTPERIPLGHINGVFGVKGWVKVFSETRPREKIVKYSPWWIKQGNEWRRIKVLAGKAQGKGVIARLEGIDDRNQAELLKGVEIAIDRDQMAPASDGEYYWIDLVGLRVENLEGVELGKIKSLFETGANDVIVVSGKKEHLIPFVQGQYVMNIDLSEGVMRVDWDPEF